MDIDLSFLPGTWLIARGTWRDYRALARFHYRPKHPCFPTAVWVVRYRPPGAASRVVAVAVLAFPMRNASGRTQALQFSGSRRRYLHFINRHIRTIARVIVHPQFRALGLSSLLVRCMCQHCNTRYLEAIAQMGRAHPFFERGGMQRYEPTRPDDPVYYLYRGTDRKGSDPFLSTRMTKISKKAWKIACDKKGSDPFLSKATVC